ncbi:MAG: N-acetyl-alpha-D-glucosaminyl L-malate synthase BshA [Archangium sp.]|nr:N-acetyl-alpha-D-glucosaminyl L-malate synthase BshA [Archangium sp.]
MSGLRIGIVCHATYGGSGVIATELGLSLAERGHDVHFVAAARPPRLGDAKNVTVHAVNVPTHPVLPSGDLGLALASTLTRLELDVVHVHYALPFAVSAALAGEVLGKKAWALVVTVHGTDVLTLGADEAYAPMVRHALRRAQLVTAPSRFLATKATALGDVDVQVLSNFVDTTRFTPGAPAGRVLVHNSNFRSVKRIEDVLAIHARSGADELLLLGDGPERANVERVIRRDGVRGVTLLGECRDVAPHLRRGAVFLLPSELESFGLAALEAMSCGVPVVASNVGGLPEVVTHGVNGFLHAVGDVAAMAESARTLLDDTELHHRKSKAARDAAVSRFQLSPIVDQWEAHYRRLTRTP